MKNIATLIKFGVTGLAATAIHLAVVAVLISQLAWGVGLSNGIGFMISTVFSNYINTVWSFQAKMSRKVVIRFWTVALFGCALAVSIANVIEAAGYHYAIGVLVIAMTVPIVSFSLHKVWTYKEN